eukprot:SAG22_NODE_3704_length_1566_cov_1.912065_2_plen_119_part_00
MRFFLEPIILTINYATEVLGYEKIVMMGLSGGGWSTTIAAAVDPRIDLSMPTAGSIPCEFKHTSWDYEQWGACGYDKQNKPVKKLPANCECSVPSPRFSCLQDSAACEFAFSYLFHAF